MSSEPQTTRIAGLAAFAAATFVVSVAAVAALDRAGAPGRLVEALGPVLALIALTVFGAGARNATLALFLAAGRRTPPVYAALAVVAAATGMALALGQDAGSAPDAVRLGAMIGVGLGAAALAPLLRRFGAASLSDVVATRFPAPWVRGPSGLFAGAAAILAAFAGYSVAVAVAQALLTSNRTGAETMVAAALLATVAPGGLSSLTWSAAATGGGLVLIALLGWAVPSAADGTAANSAAAMLAAMSLASPQALADLVGAAVGAAGLIGAAPPTVGCPTTGTAAKAGAIAALLFVGLAFAALSGAAFPIETGGFPADPVAASLTGAAKLAAALALAGVGVHGAARSFGGVALASPSRPFAMLASVRLARMRVAQTIVVIGLAVADRLGLVDPPTALIVAMALTLAVTAPIGALAAIRRAGPLAATAAMLTAVTVLSARWAAGGAHPETANLLADALAAGASAFLVGSLVALVAPARDPAPRPEAFDRFSGPSG